MSLNRIATTTSASATMPARYSDDMVTPEERAAGMRVRMPAGGTVGGLRGYNGVTTTVRGGKYSTTTIRVPASIVVLLSAA